MIVRSSLAALVAAALLAAVAPAATTSGIAGQVLERAPGLGCLRAPCVRAAPGVPVTLRHGAVVVATRSDRLGRFRVRLAAGLWTVSAPGLLSLRHPLVVRVPSGAFVHVALLVAGAAE